MAGELVRERRGRLGRHREEGQVKTEAKVGLMSFYMEGCQELPEAGRGKHSSLEPSKGGSYTNPLIPIFRPAYENITINFWFFQATTYRPRK